ncbi:hypothetical protein P618_200297 [Holospora obtusa F1]|uniref:Uncharacterized protein n=1 Tax=Holospora obtusa F1 TaxID=1399147 RepID=W6TEB1_HOLOB|nr:hypothetical protein [Holospora obtusa]ETZ07508.1 hypothetical protein P618_200297 [Holospora obtusa F1]
MKKIKILGIIGCVLIFAIFWIWWEKRSIYLIQENLSLQKFMKSN